MRDHLYRWFWRRQAKRWGITPAMRERFLRRSNGSW